MNGNQSGMAIVDGLESRTLLSASHFEFGGGSRHTPPPPSPAVQADQAQLLTDRKQLAADIQANASTIRADLAALNTAIQTAKGTTPYTTDLPALQAAQTALQTKITADLQAVAAARGNTANLTLAVQALQADESSTSPLRVAIQTAQQTLQNDIKTNAGVVNAQAKLTTDSQAIVNDQALIQGDELQLRLDLAAQNGSTKPVSPELGDLGLGDLGLGDFGHGDGFNLGGLGLGGLGLGDFGFGGLGDLGHLGSAATNSTIQKDLSQLQTDRAALATDLQSALPAIQKDLAAIQTAIKNAKTVAPYTTDLTALQAAQTAYQTQITTDLKNVLAARGTSGLTSAVQTLLNDESSTSPLKAAIQAAATKLQGDLTAAAASAQAQLLTDSQPVLNDQALIQSDLAQLKSDLAKLSTTTGGTTGGATTTTAAAAFRR